MTCISLSSIEHFHLRDFFRSFVPKIFQLFLSPEITHNPNGKLVHGVHSKTMMYNIPRNLKSFPCPIIKEVPKMYRRDKVLLLPISLILPFLHLIFFSSVFLFTPSPFPLFSVPFYLVA